LNVLFDDELVLLETESLLPNGAVVLDTSFPVGDFVGALVDVTTGCEVPADSCIARADGALLIGFVVVCDEVTAIIGEVVGALLTGFIVVGDKVAKAIGGSVGALLVGLLVVGDKVTGVIVMGELVGALLIGRIVVGCKVVGLAVDVIDGKGELANEAIFVCVQFPKRVVCE